MNEISTLIMLQLNLNKLKKITIIKFNNYIWLKNTLKFKFNFFIINVVGRIFKWVKYSTYMHFLIPLSNKPYFFIKNNYYVYTSKTITPIYIFQTLVNNYNIIKKLLKIKKPSIFNKRGFRVSNRILYKKKGKITTYVTNK